MTFIANVFTFVAIKKNPAEAEYIPIINSHDIDIKFIEYR